MVYRNSLKRESLVEWNLSQMEQELYKLVLKDRRICWKLSTRVPKNNQGIVGCTPTNVPLWEIPI